MCIIFVSCLNTLTNTKITSYECICDASIGYIFTWLPTSYKHSSICVLTSYNMYASMLFVLACCVMQQCHAADEPIPIVSQTQDGPNPDGSYKWTFESGNGIKADEEGSVANAGSENEAMQVKGSSSYTGDDGKPISLTYTANENGFVAEGSHLPVAPEIPPLIQKALEWIKAHPSEEDKPAKA